MNPASPIHFACWKMAGKFANGGHMTPRSCNRCKYMLVTKCLNFVLVTMEMLISQGLSAL